VAALAAEIVFVTRSTDFPNGSGIPYWVVWIGATAVTLGGGTALVARLRPARPRLRPVEALAAIAVVAMVLTDVTMAWQPLRDLAIYLDAGHHFLDGAPVYTQTPLTAQPVDRSLYPFVYPPCTLPLFALLAALPGPIAGAIWVAGSAGLALAAMRLFGLPRRWLLPVLLWPPFFEGLWVGNVAMPALAFFALAPWLGAGLLLGAVFKSYTGLAALWLVRERCWAQAEAGLLILLGLVVATLPFTGLGLWSDWLGGLSAYQTSQGLVPALYGFGLARFMPFALYAVLAVLALLGALRPRGLESLARLGTATVVASPSLFGHGLLMAVPSILSLRAPWLWLAVGLLSTPDGLPWWLAVAVVAASWALPGLRNAPAGGSAESLPAGEPLHPLGTGQRPWPRWGAEATAP
jgi:hypothetical protein